MQVIAGFGFRGSAGLDSLRDALNREPRRAIGSRRLQHPQTKPRPPACARSPTTSIYQ